MAEGDDGKGGRRRREPAKKAAPRKTAARKPAPRKAPAKAAPRRGKRVAHEQPTEVTEADRATAREQLGNVVPIRAAQQPGSRKRNRDGGGPSGTSSATTPEALSIHDRRIRAMNLRRLGMTWAMVAEAIREHPDIPDGYCAADAYNDVKAILDSVTVEAVQSLRNEDLAILASLQRSVYPKAIESDDPVWVDKMLKILDARAKYAGLYAPQRVALSGPDGGPIELTSATPEQLYAAAVGALDDVLAHTAPAELPGVPG